MQQRTLENLILENKNYVFDGDLIISGDVITKNSNISITGTLSILNEHSTISITGGDIIASKLISYSNIKIRNGVICVPYLEVADIYSDKDIEILKCISADNIKCLNYLVNGDNNCLNITATEDIYIKGSNNSYSINARNVLIYKDCNLNNHALTAKSFICSGKLSGCSSLSIG